MHAASSLVRSCTAVGILMRAVSASSSLPVRWGPRDFDVAGETAAHRERDAEERRSVRAAPAFVGVAPLAPSNLLPGTLILSVTDACWWMASDQCAKALSPVPVDGRRVERHSISRMRWIGRIHSLGGHLLAGQARWWWCRPPGSVTLHRTSWVGLDVAAGRRNAARRRPAADSVVERRARRRRPGG